MSKAVVGSAADVPSQARAQRCCWCQTLLQALRWMSAGVQNPGGLLQGDDLRQLTALSREAAEILWEMAAMNDAGDAAQEMLEKSTTLQARALLARARACSLALSFVAPDAGAAAGYDRRLQGHRRGGAGRQAVCSADV